MNHCIITGRVSKPAETLATKTGKVFKSFRIEVDSGGQYPDRFKVVVFGKAGETLPALAEGAEVLCAGRVQAAGYLSKTDGQPRAQLSLVAVSVEVLAGSATAPATPAPAKEPGEDDVPF